MIVSGIKWISVGEREAEVEITDGTFICDVFCHPCWVNVGDQIHKPLHILSMRHVMLSRDSDVGIWDLTNLGFSKKVIAQLKDRERQVMAVGQIVLVSDDPLPGGVESGDFIEFECGRIDLW